MDHREVIERGLIEAYHRGGIPPEEEEAFEAHFFACPECTEQLELARGFERGLKAAVAEDLARVSAQAVLARRAALRWRIALAALLVAAGLPLLWLGRERGTLRGELQAARQEGETARSRAGELEGQLQAEREESREKQRG